MAEVLVPRPAATVIIAREAARLEVLMLRRNLNSDFVGGAYVFPGGRVEDGDAALAAHMLGPSEPEAARRLGLEHGALAYYVAALRETFEEAGLLLVVDIHGGQVDLSPWRGELIDWRDRLNAHAASMVEMLAEHSWVLDARSMKYLAHWVTPIGPPRRYDTRFFVVPAPSDQLAVHDDAEVVEARWISPTEALAAQAEGRFEMIFPTIRTLEEIAVFERLDDLLAFAEARRPRRREPRIITGPNGPLVELDEED